LWPRLRYCLKFAWREREKPRKTSVRIASLLHQDLNSIPHKYEARMLPIQPNISMYWLVLVFHIQEVQVSSLSRAISYPDYFHELPQSLQICFGIVS
jgi:hypothetical protein